MVSIEDIRPIGPDEGAHRLASLMIHFKSGALSNAFISRDICDIVNGLIVFGASEQKRFTDEWIDQRQPVRAPLRLNPPRVDG